MSLAFFRCCPAFAALAFSGVVCLRLIHTAGHFPLRAVSGPFRGVHPFAFGEFFLRSVPSGACARPISVSPTRCPDRPDSSRVFVCSNLRLSVCGFRSVPGSAGGIFGGGSLLFRSGLRPPPLCSPSFAVLSHLAQACVRVPVHERPLVHGLGPSGLRTAILRPLSWLRSS